MQESELTGDLFMIAADREVPQQTRASTPEGRLVERVRAGDEEAFNELYRRFAPMVHGIIVSRVGRDNADDVLQDVFISAFRNLKSLKDAENIGAWLAALARNRSTDLHRKTRPQCELSENIERSTGPDTLRAGEILTAIRSLPEAYRETLILRLVEGMTGPEIARQTGLTPDSVRVNLHRGMKMLRQKLGIEVKR